MGNPIHNFKHTPEIQNHRILTTHPLTFNLDVLRSPQLQFRVLLGYFEVLPMFLIVLVEKSFRFSEVYIWRKFQGYVSGSKDKMMAVVVTQ